MPQTDIIYFDIAAVVIMFVTVASLVFRGLTKGAANRVYLSAMTLLTLTALAGLAGEVYDAFIGVNIMTPLGSIDFGSPGASSASGAAAATVSASAAPAPAGSDYPLMLRNFVTIIYYALRSLAAPAYLVLITVVSDTSHRLNRRNIVRPLLWVPMIAVLVVIVTNPFHHLIFSYENGLAHRGPLIWLLYADAVYYSLIGVYWLIRWRSILSSDEFTTLILLYPIILATAAIQYQTPGLHLEMFVTSIAMMLISAFVIRPEERQDALLEAASLNSYNEMCRRAFVTDKNLCLVYIEMVNPERLRELVGKDGLQNITRNVAKNLSKTLARDDIMYYLRNGQFCISARNTDPARAFEIARRTHEEGKAAASKHGKTASAGLRSCVVRVPEDAHDLATLNAFVRRYSHLVPESTVTTYEELSKRKDFALQMALSDVLDRAIETRSFEVYYQPIYCLADGRFHSAEALVRLKDRTFGWVSPSLFVPVAEQSGAIVDIGAILLDKICAFLGSVDFEATQLHYVEVNLSAEQCVRFDMAGELVDLMDKYGVDPARMNLEITETSAAYSQQIIEDNVRALSAIGVTFSLDDYGTGYSNVTRMLSLPFTLVKIDKSFVDALDDPSLRTVFAETVAMMKSIGKDVLVEGVETDEQVEALAAMEVDFIQGYYYAKPMPQDEFVAFLRERNS